MQFSHNLDILKYYNEKGLPKIVSMGVMDEGIGKQYYQRFNLSDKLEQVWKKLFRGIYKTINHKRLARLSINDVILFPICAFPFKMKEMVKHFSPSSVNLEIPMAVYNVK